MLTHLSLFTGIGGIDLAAEWAGFTTIGQCEIDPFCRDVLYRRFPDVKRWNDVRQITRDEVVGNIGLPTLITGGFPCQPHSGAGQRKGSCDSRDLWPEVRRVLSEIKPRWFVGENVAGLRSSEKGQFFGNIVRDLVQMGYRVGWGSWEAAHVGAPHHRERVFIMAHAKHDGFVSTEIATGVESRSSRCPPWAEGAEQPAGSGCCCGGDNNMAHPDNAGSRTPEPCSHRYREEANQGWEGLTFGGACGCGVAMAHSCGEGLQGSEQHRTHQCGNCQGERRAHKSTPQRNPPQDWGTWEPEPGVGRMAYGIPKRVDRLRSLGNAVVPQQVYPLLKEIAEYEKL
jgi:DNA (cytosine-5)-methyltransferase 1